MNNTTVTQQQPTTVTDGQSNAPQLNTQLLDKLCERFLSDNQDNIKLSYYTEGYYNGRARAFEDVIDLISDTIEKAYSQ